MADVTLKVGGTAYTGWKTARVTRGIEAVCGTFELGVSAPWLVEEGAECVVEVAGQRVLTGYVDRRRVSLSATGHSVEVAGRDRTGDLVDSSAVLRKWEFFRTPVLELARQLAEPHGVDVALQAGLVPDAPPEKLSVDPGDTVFEVIERACRAAALLVVSDGDGGLLLTRPGATRASTEVVEGANLLAVAVDVDTTGRFRRYVVRGQHSGGDALSGSTAATVQASAEDRNVGRAARVLLVRPEGNVTPAHAKRRAEWEASVRAARALTVTVTVQGWTQASGALWPLNALVRVRVPTHGIDGDFLVTQAVYSLDDSSGTRTEMTLRLPEAFRPEPVIPKRQKKKAGALL